jgi:phosphatidate cytidylyltransferase
VGRKFGKNKLARHVSPGKSWEGVWGGVVIAAIVAYLGGIWLGHERLTLAVFIAVALVTVAFSVIGDLTESYFKRRVGVKDSGRILPGHGGVLDRIDSMTAAAPIFALGYWLMETYL